jgi:transcriptional regulator GlxA family with amidase domain
MLFDMKNPTLEQNEPANGMNRSDVADRGRITASEVADRIGRSIAYMVEHLDRPLQISTLAAQASVSPSHYFALFKRQMGTAPMDYFIRLRMNHARQLLDSTCFSVKEVAATMGYDDPFYFSRVFKSVHRVAPAEYRRRNGQGRSAGPPVSVLRVEPLAVAVEGIVEAG